MLLWPRFKVVFDTHLASVRNAAERSLFIDDSGGHYFMRRYAELASSLFTLAAVHGDSQLDSSMARC